MLRLGDGFAQFFSELVEKVLGSVSLIPNNYLDVFDVMHVKHKKIIFEGKCFQVEFRSIISTGIVCNEHYILFG